MFVGFTSFIEKDASLWFESCEKLLLEIWKIVHRSLNKLNIIRYKLMVVVRKLDIYQKHSFEDVYRFLQFNLTHTLKSLTNDICGNF